MIKLQGQIADVQSELRQAKWDELFLALRHCVDSQVNAFAFLIRAECRRRCPRWKWYWAQWTETQAETWAAERLTETTVRVYVGLMTFDGHFVGRQFVVNDAKFKHVSGASHWQFTDCPFVEPGGLRFESVYPGSWLYVGDSVFEALREVCADPVRGGAADAEDAESGLRDGYMRLRREAFDAKDAKRLRVIDEEWRRLLAERGVRGEIGADDLRVYVEARMRGEWSPGEADVIGFPIESGREPQLLRRNTA
jgi:hypothetical protein